MPVGFAAGIGFAVAAFWMLLGFILFNANSPLIGTLYYAGARIVCPIFSIISMHSE